MKYLKKNLLLICILVCIDQLIKFTIYKNCMEANIPLLSDFVAFRPLRNTNLSWAGNYLKLSRNPIFLYGLNILGMILIPIVYNYFWQTTVVETKLSRFLYTTIMAGMICSFVDKLGGGSIDYIYLKNLFIFDLKDCYLSMWEISVLIFVVTHWKEQKNFKLRDVVRFYRRKQD